MMRVLILSCILGTLPIVTQGQSQAPPPLVDHHQHLFGPAIMAKSPSPQLVEAGDLIALLDKAGIRRAVILSVAYMFSNPNRPAVEDEYAHVKAENDWTSQQVARFPDRLIGFCSINPLKEYAIPEIERCAKDPKLHYGLKLHFGNSDVQLENEEQVEKVRKVFRAANDHGMAIVVHLRSSITRDRLYGAPQAQIFLDRVLPAAPDVPVQIAHLAGSGGYDDPTVDEAMGVFVDAIAKHDARMTRVYFDVSGVAGYGKWAEKTALISKRIREIGVSRILYGSDGAAGDNLQPREAWEAFRKLPLTDAEFRTIATNVAPYLK